MKTFEIEYLVDDEDDPDEVSTEFYTVEAEDEEAADAKFQEEVSDFIIIEAIREI
jgi:hypothetical protein